MDGYSRLIAWLKVLLPLMALGILSTLFLLSRSTEPTATIPFAESDIRGRLQGQQVTGPFFSGTTTDGDQVTVSAGKLLTRGGQVGENAAEDISAQIDLVGGTRVILFADTGTVSVAQSEANLTGNVVITTSTGFKLTTDRLEAAIDALKLVAPTPVVGTGPMGSLDAGAMTLSQAKGQENPHLFFTNGVKLVYRPGNVRE